jgi:hypothetical protein
MEDSHKWRFEEIEGVKCIVWDNPILTSDKEKVKRRKIKEKTGMSNKYVPIVENR